jgi:hypothetical protein
MRNIKTPLLLAGIAAAAYLTFRQFSGFAKTVTVRLGKIKFNPSATQQTIFTKAVFDVFLIVNNPSNFSGLVQGIKLNISLGGRLLATVNKTDRLTLQSNGETIIPVQVGISTLTLFGNISNAIQQLSGGSPLTFQVTGTVLTNYGQVDINESIRTSA